MVNLKTTGEVAKKDGTTLANFNKSEFYSTSTVDKSSIRLNNDPIFTSESVDCYQFTGSDAYYFEGNENSQACRDDVLIVFKNRTKKESSLIARKERKVNRAKKSLNNLPKFYKDSLFKEVGGWRSTLIGVVINVIFWLLAFPSFSTTSAGGSINSSVGVIVMFVFISLMLQVFFYYAYFTGKMLAGTDYSAALDLHLKKTRLQEKLRKAVEDAPTFTDSDELFVVQPVSQAHKIAQHSEDAKNMLHEKLRSTPEVEEFNSWGKAVNEIFELQKSMTQDFPVKLIPMMSDDALVVAADLRDKVSLLSASRALDGGASTPMIEDSKATRAGAESFISHLGNADLKQENS